MTTVTAVAIAVMAIARQVQTLDGVTFYEHPGVLFVRARQLASSFGYSLAPSKRIWVLNSKAISSADSRRLTDGTLLIRVGALKHFGFNVRWNSGNRSAEVRSAERSGALVYIRKGDQRVVLNKNQMMLVGWQGEGVVFRSQVGIGRRGFETPDGIYRVQSYRSKMHYSSLYDGTPMPWAVQIVGNVFVHGSPVARGRSSHGCIRLPISGDNPARWFYSWVETGTPVSVQGSWPRGAKNYAQTQ